MSFGQQLPLGQRIPNSIHAVSVSIPTMRDIIGYEEKRPETLDQLSSGYPRFVVHSYLKAIETHWKRLFDSPDSSIWFTSSESMAKRLQDHLASTGTRFLKHRGVCGLRIPGDPELNKDAKLFLQHIGGFLSTRQAEDYLLAEGLIDAPQPESLHREAPLQRVLDQLAPLYGCPAEDIVLASNGMNAFFAAFEAIRAVQTPKGKTSWVKLGWLYTDTMHILDKLSGEHADNVELLDVFDLEPLENVLKTRGHEIAAIVTEAPTNPLIQTADLARIRDLATRYGVLLVIDPTVCSPYAIDVSPYADIIVNSLTKYAANEGDTMLGSVAATGACPEKDEILRRVRSLVEPVYERDLQRLAYQIPQYADLVRNCNASVAAVVAFLESHPSIKKVYWPHEARSRENFRKIARTEDSLGGLISFEYDGPLADFYDRVALPKGPSFGMKSTLLCPYIYLAHYSLATSEQGRALLQRAGISPELLRLGVGAEPVEEIIAALEAALPRP